MIEAINDKLDEHALTHQKILDQVTYTNGKVRKLYLYLTVVATATATAVLMGGGGTIIHFLVSFL